MISRRSRIIALSVALVAASSALFVARPMLALLVLAQVACVALFLLGASLRGRLRRLDERLTDIESRIGRSEKAVQTVQSRLLVAFNDVTDLRGRTETALLGRLRQTLHDEIPGRDEAADAAILGSTFAWGAPLPPAHEWNLSPSLTLALLGHLFEQRPRQIVHLGAGLSALFAAYAQKQCGGAPIAVMGHDAPTLNRLQRHITAHGLSNHLHLHEVPLAPVEVVQETFHWFALPPLEALGPIDCLVVDAPGEASGGSIYPALPLLRAQLAPGARVILLGALRSPRAAAFERWAKEFEEFQLTVINRDAGLGILTLASDRRSD